MLRRGLKQATFSTFKTSVWENMFSMTNEKIKTLKVFSYRFSSFVEKLKHRRKTTHLTRKNWTEEVYLDGVDVFCWGSGIWRVRALVHGGRSWGDDRNLRAWRVTTMVRNSGGQQMKSHFSPAGGLTCVGSGWTGTALDCDSRDSG